MSNAATPASDSSSEPIYCRFGKRNLDGMSWLGPLLNNKIGDRLNLELRREHLFFIDSPPSVSSVLERSPIAFDNGVSLNEKK